MKTFYEYFKFSMNSLGLSAPDTLFKTVMATAGTIKVIGDIVEKYGTSVTFRQVLMTVPTGYFSAAFVVEASSTLINLGVAYYAGACIGALAYATGQYSSERLFNLDDLTTNQLLNACTVKGIVVPPTLKSYMYHDFNKRISVKMTRCY